MELKYFSFTSPIGKLKISGTSEEIKAVSFLEEEDFSLIQPIHVPELFKDCEYQLNEYFLGLRKNFSLPLAPEGTAFQKKVWQSLLEIPFSKTVSYGELAYKLGDKNLMRAVGGANGKNPVAVIIPCHRVIGTTGTLTGYSGGLWRKKWLLEMEQPEKQSILI